MHAAAAATDDYNVNNMDDNNTIHKNIDVHIPGLEQFHIKCIINSEFNT